MAAGIKASTDGLFGTLQVNGADIVTFNDSGNVGIGTSSPQSDTNYGGFTVNGANGSIITLRAGNVNSGRIYTSGTDNFNIDANGTNSTNILFRTGTSSTERARIDSSGNLLVGTTDAAPRNLTSGSGIRIGSAGQIEAAGGADTNFINITAASGNMLSFRKQGGGVGNISTNGTTTSYGTTSDYRLKENIVPMTGALAKIAALKPVTYKWKSNGEATQGFIAHELQTVVPECVTGEKDAVDAEGNPQYQGIDTSFLVATLTAAIQELKALVDTQAARITALEAA